MMGDHAIYHDGWIASTKVMRPPWVVAGAVSQDPASFPYELYDLTKDWTQFDNVAAKNPEKVKELANLFFLGGGGKVPSAATRCHCRDSDRGTAAEPCSWPNGIYLVWCSHWNAKW